MESHAEKSAPCASIPWTERMVRRLAGTFVLASLLLAWKVSPWWLAMTAFVGLNLLQSSFTNFCPAEMVFRRIETRRNAKAAVPSH